MLSQRSLRTGIALLVLGVGVLALWQAGLIFSSSDGTTPEGQQLEAADISIETPNPSGLTVGLREGDLAPDFEFSSFDGRRLKLSDFRGQVVLLNFWASWCVPCRQEMPDLEALQQRHGADKVAVLAINNGEFLGPASSFIDKLGVQLTAFGYDQRGDVMRRYAIPGIQGLPVTYFIDAAGVITRVIPGQMSAKMMEDGAIEALTGGLRPE